MKKLKAMVIRYPRHFSQASNMNPKVGKTTNGSRNVLSAEMAERTHVAEIRKSSYVLSFLLLG